MARIGRFAPPVALMGVIWALSAQPDLNSGLGTVDLVGRKGIHMAEFGLLWWLWSRAFDHERPAVAAAIAIGWAAVDEVHQTGVHGRHGTPIDVLIDTAGVAAAWIVTRRRG